MDSQELSSECDSFETTLVIAWEEGDDTSADPDAAVVEEGDISLQLDNSSNNRRSQFRPRPGGKAGATSYQLRQYAEATLGGGSLRKIVKLPEGEDENEWFAVNSMSITTDVEHSRTLSDTNHSGGLLQPDKSALRSHHRVLFASIMSRDEGHR